jgi:hypothetical protein
MDEQDMAYEDAGDDGWDDDGDDGWEEEDVDQIALMPDQVPLGFKKTSSINSGFGGKGFRSYTSAQIVKNIPAKVRAAQELLCIEDDDKVISILRYYDWNQAKVEQEWFDKMDELELKIGLRYNTELIKKYPDINASLKENN